MRQSEQLKIVLRKCYEVYAINKTRTYNDIMEALKAEEVLIDNDEAIMLGKRLEGDGMVIFARRYGTVDNPHVQLTSYGVEMCESGVLFPVKNLVPLGDIAPEIFSEIAESASRSIPFLDNNLMGTAVEEAQNGYEESKTEYAAKETENILPYLEASEPPLKITDDINFATVRQAQDEIIYEEMTPSDTNESEETTEVYYEEAVAEKPEAPAYDVNEAEHPKPVIVANDESGELNILDLIISDKETNSATELPAEITESEQKGGQILSETENVQVNVPHIAMMAKSIQMPSATRILPDTTDAERELMDLLNSIKKSTIASDIDKQIRLEIVERIEEVAFYYTASRVVPKWSVRDLIWVIERVSEPGPSVKQLRTYVP